MSCRKLMIILMALLLASALPLQADPSKGKPIKPLKQWSGSVEDLSLMKAVPEFILSAEELEKLWQGWKVPGPVPKLDFAKELVVVATTRGAYSASARLWTTRGISRLGAWPPWTCVQASAM